MIRKISCPMPKLDSDRIMLSHGSGGLMTSKLLESGVFSLLSNPFLDKKEDGAVFDLNGNVAFSSDSFVVHPLFFPGGNIGDLSVNGTINDLAMCGAKPLYLSLSFILEEGLLMEEFWKVLCSIKEAAEEAEVFIVTGDTKVVEKGKGDGIYINTSGVGKVHRQAKLGSESIRPGDRILLSAPIAAHGMAIMSVREGLEFETEIVSDTCPLHREVEKLIDELGSHIRLLRDPTRGGVGTVLNEIAKEVRLGVDIEEASLPIDEQVAAACEILGIDPLYVANEGVFLAIVSSEVADRAVEIMQKQKNGIKARCIGTVTCDHPGKVVMKSLIGGKRVVGMLAGEQLPRIC